MVEGVGWEVGGSRVGCGWDGNSKLWIRVTDLVSRTDPSSGCLTCLVSPDNPKDEPCPPFEADTARMSKVGAYGANSKVRCRLVGY